MLDWLDFKIANSFMIVSSATIWQVLIGIHVCVSKATGIEPLEHHLVIITVK
jgi:hypothetical protein